MEEEVIGTSRLGGLMIGPSSLVTIGSCGGLSAMVAPRVQVSIGKETFWALLKYGRFGCVGDWKRSLERRWKLRGRLRWHGGLVRLGDAVIPESEAVEVLRDGDCVVIEGVRVREEEREGGGEQVEGVERHRKDRAEEDDEEGESGGEGLARVRRAVKERKRRRQVVAPVAPAKKVVKGGERSKSGKRRQRRSRLVKRLLAAVHARSPGHSVENEIPGYPIAGHRALRLKDPHSSARNADAEEVGTDLGETGVPEVTRESIRGERNHHILAANDVHLQENDTSALQTVIARSSREDNEERTVSDYEGHTTTTLPSNEINRPPPVARTSMSATLARLRAEADALFDDGPDPRSNRLLRRKARQEEQHNESLVVTAEGKMRKPKKLRPATRKQPKPEELELHDGEASIATGVQTISEIDGLADAAVGELTSGDSIYVKVLEISPTSLSPEFSEWRPANFVRAEGEHVVMRSGGASGQSILRSHFPHDDELSNPTTVEDEAVPSSLIMGIKRALPCIA